MLVASRLVRPRRWRMWCTIGGTVGTATRRRERLCLRPGVSALRRNMNCWPDVSMYERTALALRALHDHCKAQILRQPDSLSMCMLIAMRICLHELRMCLHVVCLCRQAVLAWALIGASVPLARWARHVHIGAFLALVLKGDATVLGLSIC
jgi:hypothetical protein